MASGSTASAPSARWRCERPEVTLAGVREALLGLGGLEEVEGFAVFGSLGGQQARRFHPERSDIDVLVVLKEEHAALENVDRWVERVMDAVDRRFRRPVDVMVLSLRGLKRVPSWHTISMASDCPILYDPNGRVGRVFARIVAAAREAGLAQKWVGEQRVWAKKNPKFGERIVVEVRDDDG